jgi:hypothetical protein
MRYLRDLRWLVTAFMGVMLTACLVPAGATSANISHSYYADKGIANGSIVSLDPSKSDYVQAANDTNGRRLVGVAVDSNDSLLAVDAARSKIQVAISGTVNTLVSTINGPIKVGDRIGVSPFNGVGMKTVPSSYTIGLAQTAFDSNSPGTSTQEVKNKAGQTARLQVGYVRLNVAIGIDTSSGSAPSLNALQRIAKSLTGHTISTVRAVISLLIAAVTVVSLITLIYASIYGSIISIGRNPLAKYAIFRTLTSVLAMAVILAITAGIMIYLLLR